MTDSQVLASITMAANSIMFVGAGVGYFRALRRHDRSAGLNALFALLGLAGASVGGAILVRPKSDSLAWLLTALALVALIAFVLLLRHQRRQAIGR